MLLSELGELLALDLSWILLGMLLHLPLDLVARLLIQVLRLVLAVVVGSRGHVKVEDDVLLDEFLNRYVLVVALVNFLNFLLFHSRKLAWVIVHRLEILGLLVLVQLVLLASRHVVDWNTSQDWFLAIHALGRVPEEVNWDLVVAEQVGVIYQETVQVLELLPAHYILSVRGFLQPHHVCADLLLDEALDPDGLLGVVVGHAELNLLLDPTVVGHYVL